MRKFKDNRGFTLIEVLAAIVIISIILISFFQLFIQTNKTAAFNNERLVTINLADAALAKIQAKAYTKTSNDIVNEFINDSSKPTTFAMNGKTYTISYQASQGINKVTNANYSEKDLNLIKVVVTVTAPDGKTRGSSEGYVRYD